MISVDLGAMTPEERREFEMLQAEHQAFWEEQMAWPTPRRSVKEAVSDFWEDHPGWSKFIIFVVLATLIVSCCIWRTVAALSLTVLIFGLLGLCAWAICSIIYTLISDWLF